MKYSVFFTLLLTLSLTGAQAQVKKGGLFGFGSDDQISADLFPTTPASLTTPSPRQEIQPVAPSAPAAPARSDDDTIFRGGEPSEIEAISYVIENGEKVERKVESKRRGGLLGFGKKNDEAVDVIAPVPIPSYTDPGTAAPLTEVVQNTPAPVEATAAVMEAVNAPVEEKKEKSGGFFSFFGKKSEEVADTPTFAVPDSTEMADAADPVVATVTEASANPYQPATTASTESAPVAPVSADPVPQFEGSPAGEKREKDGFSLPNPIAKMRNQKEEKTIDLTGAQTIIQNGEIVAPQDDIVTSNREESSESSVRQPPRIVDGVKTYSSWDDVNARSQSAADKILNQIR